MDTHDAELKKELDATVQARRELGGEYESALIESFLEKVEQRLDATVDRQVRRQVAEQQLVVARGSRPQEGSEDSWGERFGFGVVSMILAIPLSAIGVANEGLAGLVVAWAGIVGVNALGNLRAARSLPRLGSRRERREPDWDS